MRVVACSVAYGSHDGLWPWEDNEWLLEEEARQCGLRRQVDDMIRTSISDSVLGSRVESAVRADCTAVVCYCAEC